MSRFVFESMLPASNSEHGEANTPEKEQVEGFLESYMKRRKTSADDPLTSQSQSRYDASGLAPYYSREEDVPEHLKKCEFFETH